MVSGESIALGRYVLLRRLGTGGPVEVCLALQRSVAGVEKLVVIKRLKREFAADQRLADELLEEARIAGQLTHVNIAQVFDVGADEHCYYFAMEHAYGKSLRSVLQALEDRGEVLPVEHAIHIATLICSALAHAHDQKDFREQHVPIVHGGLSPDNVLVTFAGGVKIADFGLVASKKGRAEVPLAYSAPEQMKGEGVDPRTDIFALGMLLLELTTGKAPLNRPPDFAPGYPPKLAAILLQAAARRRTHRHSSATELVAQLEAFAQSSGTRTSPAGFGKFLQGLFPEAEERLNRERREAKLIGSPRGEAVTIPETHPPAPEPAEFTPGALTPASADLESELQSAGLRPLTRTSAPPAVHSNRPRLESNGYLVVATALGVGVLVGVAARSFVRERAPASAAVATFNPARENRDTDANVGSLEVESEPAGANVFLEGELAAEVTPTTLRRLPLGRPLHVRVVRPGFETYQGEIKLAKDKPRDRLVAALSPASLTLLLSIDAPDPAIWIDGKYSSSRTIAGLAVDQDHKIAVSAPGRVGKILIFRSELGGEKRLDLKLDPARVSK